MTINKLTTILWGVATLGIATAMATPAQASSFTVPLVGGNGFVNATITSGGLSIGATVYDSVKLGDQLFSDFSFGGDVGAGDKLRFVLNQDVWTVNFREETSLGVANGTLEYKVKIVAISTPPPSFRYDYIRYRYIWTGWKHKLSRYQEGFHTRWYSAYHPNFHKRL
ncbi:hypothetical protein [Microcystis aeruginosa]|nr:hypothetical protein [Microcystis aeruginosa]